MAEVRGHKKILAIKLSNFSPTDNCNSLKYIKSPNKFEDPNGVVRLGILAAMSNNQNSNKAAILVISPRNTSNPMPILSYNSNLKKNKQPTIEEMEMCEEYTRVISHVGSNLVKKREYFDDQFLGNGYQKSFIVAAASAPHETFRMADFLNTCSFCLKQLQGLDIFIYRQFAKGDALSQLGSNAVSSFYCILINTLTDLDDKTVLGKREAFKGPKSLLETARGDKAFCSSECRFKQISIDEQKEKCGSGAMKSPEYSASPCCCPMQFSAGVAVA